MSTVFINRRFKNVHCIYLVQDGKESRAFVNRVVVLEVPYVARDLTWAEKPSASEGEVSYMAKITNKILREASRVMTLAPELGGIKAAWNLCTSIIRRRWAKWLQLRQTLPSPAKYPNSGKIACFFFNENSKYFPYIIRNRLIYL
jgi:hypothetical protein